MLGTSPETPLGPGSGHRLCMWKDRTWQKYSFLLLFILRLFLASRDTQAPDCFVIPIL